MEHLAILPRVHAAPDAELASLYAAVEALSAAVESGRDPETCALAAREVEARARAIAERFHPSLSPLARSFTPPPGSQPALRFSVLLVDDDPDQLALLQRILDPWFRVLLAHSNREAAELLRTASPDVVLTDLYLPDQSGLALLELASAAEEPLRVPLIVLSGRADTEAKVLAFEAGAFDFISHPTAPEELVARIRNALAHSQLLRQERAIGGRDDLTGLCNRRAFRTFLESALRRAREQAVPLTLVLVDQDRLKAINDTWGHLAGDEALRTLAHALASSTRGTDCAARVGGDEFALVIPGCDRAGAERMRARVEESLRRSPVTLPCGTRLFVEASFGLACLDEEGGVEEMDELIRRADAELYRCKRAHRATVKG